MSLAVSRGSARVAWDQVNDALEQRGQSTAALSCRLGQDVYIDYSIGSTTAVSLAVGRGSARVAWGQVSDALEQRGQSTATFSCWLAQDAYIDALERI